MPRGTHKKKVWIGRCNRMIEYVDPLVAKSLQALRERAQHPVQLALIMCKATRHDVFTSLETTPYAAIKYSAKIREEMLGIQPDGLIVTIAMEGRGAWHGCGRHRLL